jgi:hypothetical protein
VTDRRSPVIRYDDFRDAILVPYEPPVLPRGFDFESRPLRGPGRDIRHVPGVVFDAIKARRPHRHHQLDHLLSTRRDGGLDRGEVLLGCRESDRVDDRLETLRADGRHGQTGEPHDNSNQAGPVRQPPLHAAVPKAWTGKNGASMRSSGGRVGAPSVRVMHPASFGRLYQPEARVLKLRIWWCPWTTEQRAMGHRRMSSSNRSVPTLAQ